MVEVLRKLNNDLIKLNANNEENLKKYKLIQEILSDDKCFFKMEIEYAYSILRDLGIEEKDLKNVYMKLIDSNNI